MNLSRINDDHAGDLDMLVQELEAALLRRALEVVPVRPVQSALGFRERFEEPEPEHEPEHEPEPEPGPAMRPWRVAVGVVQQRQRALLEFHVRLL